MILFCDWLKLYSRNKTTNIVNKLSNDEPTFNNFLCNKGIEFEKNFYKIH